MPHLLPSLFRHAKRRIKAAQRDQRMFYLHQAGRQLLASKDYESVSVAAIARKAGISVGAFYERYSSKDAFLQALSMTGVGMQWRALSENSVLSNGGARGGRPSFGL